MPPVHPELQPFDVDREGSTWLPRTDLDRLLQVITEIDDHQPKPQFQG